MALSKLEDPKTILDVGAHVGIVSIYLAKKFPNAQITALEPFPINYFNLCRNLELNEITNVTPVNLAVTADGRDIALACPDYNTGGAIPHITALDPFIKSTTLNDLLSENTYDFVKIDIEGFEYEIFNKFEYFRNIKDLSVELHSIHNEPGSKWRPKMRALAQYLESAPITGSLWMPDLDDV
jgi:FkbM family methyltransferase